jgi:hypothetical protein
MNNDTKIGGIYMRFGLLQGLQRLKFEGFVRQLTDEEFGV